MMKKSGVTLVELIVSMAIMLIVMGIIGAIFSSGAKCYKSEMSRVSIEDESRRALNEICRGIREAQNIQIINNSNATVKGLSGTSILCAEITPYDNKAPYEYIINNNNLIKYYSKDSYVKVASEINKITILYNNSYDITVEMSGQSSNNMYMTSVSLNRGE